MGTDIHGWVEYWNPGTESWVGLIKLSSLVSDRNYELFAWLFGVRRRPDIPMRWNYPPIAAGRGLPADASQEVATEYTSDVEQYPTEYYGVTWISWREMQAIDWDERIEDQIIESRRDASDPPHFGTHHWRSQFLRTHTAVLPDQADALTPGHRWTVGDKVYEVVAMRRRDVLDGPWDVLFKVLDALASRCQDSDKLRLVVWFDS